jgi:nucleoside-diphosphate-sugar epimerase
MRILVTGGTGFVGCHFVAALLDSGHEVVLLARALTGRGRADATVAWLHAQGHVSDRQAGAAPGVPWQAGDRTEPKPL